jgi:glucose-6-phosphate 1-dehydrogenase
MAQLVPAETFDLVIFGGTGDLAMRKLLPALYHRDLDGQLTPDSRIVAASRGELSSEDYRGLVEEALRRNLAEGEFDESFWQTFANRIHYVQTDALAHDDWSPLVQLLDSAEDRVRVA